MWEDTHAVLVTQITRRNELIVWLGAGDMEQVLELSRDACWWAAQKGITRAHFTGRRGWERVPAITEDGWVKASTHFFKELNDGQGKQRDTDLQPVP